MLAGGASWLFFGKEAGNLKKMILEMENRGELLNALRQRAAQRIRENYTWEKIVAPYSLLFENMVK